MYEEHAKRGKCVQVSYDLFWFYSWLEDKVAPDFQANHFAY